MSTKPVRIAYFVTHPIQYQVPLLRMIAADPSIELKVFFSADFSVDAHYDPEFQQEIKWEIDLTGGYDYEVLPALNPSTVVTVLRPLNYGVIWRLVTGRFDVVWCHSYARLPHMTAIVAGAFLGKRIFLRDDASRYSLAPGPVKGFVKRLFLRTLNLFLDGVLTVGTLNREYYQGYGFPDRKLFPLRYAVDNDWYREKISAASDKKTDLRRSLGIKDGCPVVLFVGKFRAQKRGNDLIEAFTKIASDPQCGNPCLVMVGAGEMRDTWEQAARSAPEGSILFPGFKGIAELPAIFDLCDVFVIPSEIERWGLVVNEAMIAAKPVIATEDVSAAHDLIEDGENGFIVPTGDTDAMANALVKILSDPERAAAMGSRSLDVISDWSFENNVRELKQTLAGFYGGRVV